MNNEMMEFLGFSLVECNLIDKERNKEWFVENCVGLIALAKGMTGGSRYVKADDREYCYIYEKDCEQDPLYIADITYSSGWGILTMVVDCFEGRKDFLLNKGYWYKNYKGNRAFEPKVMSCIACFNDGEAL